MNYPSSPLNNTNPKIIREFLSSQTFALIQTMSQKEYLPGKTLSPDELLLIERIYDKAVEEVVSKLTTPEPVVSFRSMDVESMVDVFCEYRCELGTDECGDDNCVLYQAVRDFGGFKSNSLPDLEEHLSKACGDCTMGPSLCYDKSCPIIDFIDDVEASLLEHGGYL